MRVGVLVSGSGTNLEAILEAGVPVDLVVADRPCQALQLAERAGVPTVLQHRTDFGKAFDRAAYSKELVRILGDHGIELVVSAGFGTVVPEVATAYPGRMLNTHPALLPAFKGWHPVRDALARGVKVTGCTVHTLTEDVDEGTILAQEAVPVLPGDTEATLHERIKRVEHRLLPETIKRVIAGELP